MKSRKYLLPFCAVLLSAVSHHCLGDMNTNSPLSVDQQLIVACYNADPVAVRQALKQGAQVDARFGKGVSKYVTDKWTLGWPIDCASWTPLIAAASSSKWPDPPRQIMNTEKDRAWAIAQRSRIPAREIEKRQNACFEIARELIKAKCDIDLSDRHGATALYISIEARKERLANLLMQSGASVNTKTKTYIDGPSQLTPLHQAYWSTTLTAELLKQGADRNAEDSDGETPLTKARRRGNADVLRVYTRADQKQ
jgi:hypothetical protein